METCLRQAGEDALLWRSEYTSRILSECRNPGIADTPQPSYCTRLRLTSVQNLDDGFSTRNTEWMQFTGEVSLGLAFAFASIHGEVGRLSQ